LNNNNKNIDLQKEELEKNNLRKTVNEVRFKEKALNLYDVVLLLLILLRYKVIINFGI
jgi:hypothetical protein